MSTKLEEYPHHWVVSTVVGPGRRAKVARSHVRVGKGDPKALKAEILRQAIAARAVFGIVEKEAAPVV